MAGKSCCYFLAMLIGLGLCMASRSVLAQEPFYKGKTLRLLVNYPAGGATDVVARLISRYLGKHIAGNPTVAVQNMPGGGGNVGANYVYEVAGRDGLTVGVFSGGYLPQILGGSGVRFDLNSMPMIAGVGETSVVYIRADTGVKGAAGNSQTDKTDRHRRIHPREQQRSGAPPHGARSARRALPLRDRLRRRGRLRLAVQRGEINYTSEGLTGYTMGGALMAREGIVVPLSRRFGRDPMAISFAICAPTCRRSRNSFAPRRKPISRDLWPTLSRFPVRCAVSVGLSSRHLRRRRRPSRRCAKVFARPLTMLNSKRRRKRPSRFQLVSFVGEDAARVNTAVFRAATGPVRDALRKMTQE